MQQVLCLPLEMLWWSLPIAIAIFWIALLVTYKQKLLNEKLCELSFIEFFSRLYLRCSKLDMWLCIQPWDWLWRSKSAYDETKLIV